MRNGKSVNFHLKHKHFLVITTISALIVIFSQCMHEPRTGDDLRGDAYANRQDCASCHRDIYQSYIETAHFLTTRPATAETVKGSFDSGSNAYSYQPDVQVRMEKRDSGLYQVAYLGDKEKESHRFDITVGSGRKAQTFLYWYGDQVFQLPVSYFVPMQSWANSPNYPARQVRFDRNIPIGCFECHSSYIKRTGVHASGEFAVDHFDKSRIIYGIDCQRCHGAAARHVSFHRQHPNEKSARHISRITSLSRQQQVDQCAVCHSGLRPSKKPSFWFQPGQQLTDYLATDTSTAPATDIDVHGNQYQLLSRSECYIKTNTLDCSSCHNVHKKERENLKTFSSRCMSCHKTGANFCKMAPVVGKAITDNCIDCHMPATPSRLISLQSSKDSIPTANLVRTHLIGIYLEESKKFLNQ